MKKKYNVTIGDSCFQIEALNIRDARRVAQFNKRHTPELRGKTTVRLAK